MCLLLQQWGCLQTRLAAPVPPPAAAAGVAPDLHGPPWRPRHLPSLHHPRASDAPVLRRQDSHSEDEATPAVVRWPGADCADPGQRRPLLPRLLLLPAHQSGNDPDLGLGGRGRGGHSTTSGPGRRYDGQQRKHHWASWGLLFSFQILLQSYGGGLAYRFHSPGIWGCECLFLHYPLYLFISVPLPAFLSSLKPILWPPPPPTIFKSPSALFLFYSFLRPLSIPLCALFFFINTLCDLFLSWSPLRTLSNQHCPHFRVPSVPTFNPFCDHFLVVPLPPHSNPISDTPPYLTTFYSPLCTLLICSAPSYYSSRCPLSNPLSDHCPVFLFPLSCLVFLSAHFPTVCRIRRIGMFLGPPRICNYFVRILSSPSKKIIKTLISAV